MADSKKPGIINRRQPGKHERAVEAKDRNVEKTRTGREIDLRDVFYAQFDAQEADLIGRLATIFNRLFRIGYPVLSKGAETMISEKVVSVSKCPETLRAVRKAMGIPEDSTALVKPVPASGKRSHGLYHITILTDAMLNFLDSEDVSRLVDKIGRIRAELSRDHPEVVDSFDSMLKHESEIRNNPLDLPEDILRFRQLVAQGRGGFVAREEHRDPATGKTRLQ